MQVDANVSEADIGSVAPGQAVTFTVDAYPEPDISGDGTRDPLGPYRGPECREL